MINQSENVVVFPGTQGRFRGGPRPVYEWLRAARHRWRTRALLAEMGDDMLRDIGITRAEASVEANKPFWRP